ncbi:MAG: Crp/Fnr family transcriptional regulator [Hyphomonadaceae bacterium]|nr:Crp/Fnr family transcriptional regulator [Hyphomonadaceae bacterium]
MKAASNKRQKPAPAAGLAALGKVGVLSGLDEAALSALAGKVRWRPVKAGEGVISHLALDASVYFIVEGEFTVSLQSAIGRHVAIRTLGPGDHFGEIAALTASPRTVNVTAQTGGLLAECSPDLFAQTLAANGALALAFARDLARTIVHLTDKVFELAALEVRFRVYAELLRLSRSGQSSGPGILIKKAPTHAALAAAIGAQREAVTREMRALAREGVLRQRGRELTILDPQRLRSLLERRAGVTASQIVDWAS